MKAEQSRNTSMGAGATIAASTLAANFTIQRPEFDVNVDLVLQPGESVALMGPSGAGKTTVIDALVGLIRPTEGRIVLDEKVLVDTVHGIHRAPNERRMGLLRQDGDLFPHLTVLDNIAFSIRVRGVATQQARAEAGEWLERISFRRFGSRYPAQLSGGQMRRVALLRTLASQPRLLLIDEPFASLDIEAAIEMRELIRDQVREHPVTMVMVSHDPRDALSLADRLLVFDHGEVIQQGAVRAVLESPQNSFVRALAASVAAA